MPGRLLLSLPPEWWLAIRKASHEADGYGKYELASVGAVAVRWYHNGRWICSGPGVYAHGVAATLTLAVREALAEVGE